MKVYGYVRDEYGNFSSRVSKTKQMSEKIGTKIHWIFCEQSDGKYENMERARFILDSLQDSVLLVSDTSDLYYDEFAMVKFMEKLKENNVLLIDCSCPKFDNALAIEDHAVDNISDWLISKMIIVLERYMRASTERKDMDCDPDIQNIARKIQEMERDFSRKNKKTAPKSSL